MDSVYHVLILQLLALNKWRRIIHGKTKRPFTADSPLPRDLVISVKVILDLEFMGSDRSQHIRYVYPVHVQ